MRREDLFSRRPRVLLPLVVVAASGCFDEKLNIYDLEGTVVLSRAATQQTMTLQIDDDGNPATPTVPRQTVVGPDRRLIGPVYLGLYSGVVYDFQEYPHPAVGPAVNDYDAQNGADNDAFPYGGTSIGDFRYACMKYFQCKMVSGRFTTYDDIVSFFGETLAAPITDARGQEVVNGDQIRAACYEALAVTADSEVRITATDDRNEDGALDASDLDFVENEDGDFVASFKIWQADYYDGMVGWAYMDAPAGGSAYMFSTCNPDQGYYESRYDQRWYAGTQKRYVLNAPHMLLQDEDWVTSYGAVWDSPWDRPEIRIDFNVGTGDIDALRAEMASKPAGEGE